MSALLGAILGAAGAAIGLIIYAGAGTKATAKNAGPAVSPEQQSFDSKTTQLAEAGNAGIDDLFGMFERQPEYSLKADWYIHAHLYLISITAHLACIYGPTAFSPENIKKFVIFTTGEVYDKYLTPKASEATPDVLAARAKLVEDAAIAYAEPALKIAEHFAALAVKETDPPSQVTAFMPIVTLLGRKTIDENYYVTIAGGRDFLQAVVDSALNISCSLLKTISDNK